VARSAGKRNFQEGRWLDEWPTERCSKVVEQIVLLKPILAYARNRKEQTGGIERMLREKLTDCGGLIGGADIFDGELLF